MTNGESRRPRVRACARSRVHAFSRRFCGRMTQEPRQALEVTPMKLLPALGVAIAAVALATLARALLFRYLAANLPYLTFFPAVIAATLWGDWSPACRDRSFVRPPAHDHVWNFLDLASVQLSTKLLERLAAVPLSHSPACRALVAANGEALKLAQLFTSYSVQAARPVPGFPDFGRGPRVARFVQAAVDWPPHPRLEVRQLRAFLSVALIQLCP